MRETTKESPIYTEHVLDLFTEIMHRMIIEEPLQEVGGDITPSLAQGLQFLSQHDACSVRDLAQGLSMSYSAASQLTDRLVKKSLATRKEKECDRRISELRLTKEGLSVVEKIQMSRVAGMTRVLDRMDQQSRRALVGNLECFISAAISDEQSALDTCTRCGREHIAECVVNEVRRSVTGIQTE